jgi:hypothetical protein
VGLYPNAISAFKKYLDELRSIFRPKEEFSLKAQRRLSRLSKRHFENATVYPEVTFVSIHVRRSDYANHLSILYNLSYVSDDYFKKATQYFREKYQVMLAEFPLNKTKSKLSLIIRFSSFIMMKFSRNVHVHYLNI